MRIVRLRLICHHSFLSTIRSSRKSLRILYHSVLSKGKCKFQHETGEEVQLSMSFLRITRKIGHFLPKDWPHKKKLAKPLCKPIHIAWSRQADACEIPSFCYSYGSTGQLPM